MREAPQLSRRQVLSGGLTGASIGIGLLALSTFFLITGDREEERLGVYIPLAVAAIALGVSAMALVPLWGDAQAGSRIALIFRLLSLGTIVMTACATATGDLPWMAGGLLPLLAAAALLKDSFRLAGR
jgi:hypothetical protein